jgi:hypothetical protein
MRKRRSEILAACLLAGLLAAAFAASRGNHRQPAAPAPGGEHRHSAWKTLGRIDSLRR